jgi:triosephosphate isomerase
MRTPLLAGNWKMYKTPAETQAFFDAFLPLVAATTGRDAAICPPYVDLPVALAATAGSNVGIGAQNMAKGKEGAMTGEISGHMLQAIGVKYVLIGHSERRQYFGENEAGVLSKTQSALEYGLIPIVCVGELLAEAGTVFENCYRLRARMGDWYRKGCLAGAGGRSPRFHPRTRGSQIRHRAGRGNAYPLRRKREG